MFVVELATLAGQSLGDLARRGLTIDRELNGGMIASCSIDSDDQAATLVAIGSTALRVWEGGELRFHGKLREPLVRRADGLDLTAGSPFTLLDRRQLMGGASFTGVDQGLILETIIEAQNLHSPTRLGMGPYEMTKLRDREYEAGKSVQEIIVQMAEVIEGPYFVETPVVDLANGFYSLLTLRGLTSGTVRPGVRFEYGDGTLGNLEGYTLTESLPVNHVTYSGTGSLLVQVEDMDSIMTYDMFMEMHSDPDVSLEQTLLEAAEALLRPHPSMTVSVDVVPSGPAEVEPPPTPRLWHDFDVGDTVFVSVRDRATELYDLPVRVTQAKLTLDEADESERLELTLETSAEATLMP